jgi:hypothetical protein
LPQSRPVIAEAVEELGENYLARYDLAQTVISRDCSGLVMKIVVRVQKRDLIAGVSKHPLH